MKTDITAYIKNLQHASDEEKKLWLIVASVIVMVVVIVLWILYLKMTIPGIAGNVQNVENVNGKESTYDILRNGLSNIGEELRRNTQKAKEQTSKGLDIIKKQVEKSNNYSIEEIPGSGVPTQNIESVPPTPLP